MSEDTNHALGAVYEPTNDDDELVVTGDADHSGFDPSVVSLVLRGDKLPLRNVVSSCYNAASQKLVVVTAPALFLYGHLVELGGEMLGMVAAEEHIQFQYAMVLPWLDAYSVIATRQNGRIEHRIVRCDVVALVLLVDTGAEHRSWVNFERNSADFSACHLTHVIAETGSFYTALANPVRREVITADSDGGFKVWVIRAAGAPNSSNTSSGWKGFQRIHAGNRKAIYLHLFLAGDDQSIVASTKTRIHAYDATTCARIGALYKDTTHTLVRAAFDRENDIVYLQCDESRRLVYKLRGASRHGRLHSFEPAGASIQGQDVVAFDAICRGDVHGDSPSPTRGTAIVLLDAVGRLSVDPCLDTGASSHGATRCSISLPIAPTSETYVALHLHTARNQPRNFAIVVCSSGLLVIEMVLPETTMPARRVTTNVAGTKVALLNETTQPRIAIFNPTPPSLLLFDEDESDTFIATLLQAPVGLEYQESTRLENQPTVNTVVDFAGLTDGVVVAWATGHVTRYCLRTERTSTCGRVAGIPTTVTSAILWETANAEWVLAGDDKGAIQIWSVQTDGAVLPICAKNLHTHSILSINTVRSESVDHTACIVTVASDGEVKLWRVSESEDLTMRWDLLVCFRTYAQAISATAFMGPEFLFCGSEEGGLECWRLPIVPPVQQTGGRVARSNVAVIKHPLHSIDLHLTRICQVIVEPGEAASRMSSAQPQSDDFAWVITYDLDDVVLVWCFSTRFLFPHRKLRPHAAPIGGILTAINESTFRFYVYLGSCLDCLDVVSEIDKVAVKRRLAQARDPAKSSVQNHFQHTRMQNTESKRRAGSTLDGLNTSLTTPVRLRVTLPSVAQVEMHVDLEAARHDSPPKIPRTKMKQEHADVIPEPITPDVDAYRDPPSQNDEFWSQGRALSPYTPTIEPVSEIVAPEETSPGVPTTRSDPSLKKPVSRFAPETVPSQFQKAKPRVYRQGPHPVATTLQTRCAVITSTIGADREPGGLPVAKSGRTERYVDQRLDEKVHQQRDRVAIVSITDDALAGHLRLDFQGSNLTRRMSMKMDDSSAERAGDDGRARLQFIPWSSLGPEEQLSELLAATRSRFIVQEASEAKLSIPTREDFASVDVKAQLRVRAFSRWYLSSQEARQRLREAFLREELRFAAQDAFVNMAMKSSGCTVPPKDQLDDDSASVWQVFARWYATGNPSFGDQELLAIECTPKRIRDRLQERTSFLKRRLETLAKAESNQAQTMKDGPYIFDRAHSSSESTTSGEDGTAWGVLSNVCRVRELLLALSDPMIQVAALADDVELPDSTLVSLENVDSLSLAASFMAWWATPGNVYREEFLDQELAEAANDPSVRDALTRSANVDEDGAKSFRETYFRSGSTREEFLAQKRRRRQRHDRLDAIFRDGKQSAPVLFEAQQAPLFIPFRFPRAIAAPLDVTEAVASAEEIVEHQSDPEEEEIYRAETGRDADEQADEWRRRREEVALMAAEDALSRELNDGYESASDEEHEIERMPIEPPKRTDFTHSYFFGNLPKAFRINGGGWVAGSGIDNGDEEVEEEERLEKERDRQEMLDRLEAERIADAERQAERLRIEKAIDEKALQMRRIRQVELKKILANQAEVEARRLEQIEHKNIMRERATMEAEERSMKAWLERVAAERAEMEREDRQAAAIALAERTAKRDEMRRVLAEMTQMDTEDRRSAVAQADQLELERHQAQRVQYLTDLYKPFEPFFPASNLPSEEMLPVISKRSKRSSKQQKRGYALPFAEALTLDADVEQELYAVRESRKLRQLMGLPVGSPHTKRMMQIPSERDIIKTRHDLQLMLPPTNDSFENDRLDVADNIEDAFGSTNTNPFSNQTDPREKRARVLPELIRFPSERDDRLTDLLATPMAASQHKKSSKVKAKAGAREQTALPFFRGNFLVEGTRPRAQAYAPK